RGEGNHGSENRSAQIAVADRNRMPRPKCDFFERLAVSVKGYFALGTTVQVIEHRPWNATLGGSAKVRNIHEARGREFLHCVRTVKSNSIARPTQPRRIMISA